MLRTSQEGGLVVPAADDGREQAEGGRGQANRRLGGSSSRANMFDSSSSDETQTRQAHDLRVPLRLQPQASNMLALNSASLTLLALPRAVPPSLQRGTFSAARAAVAMAADDDDDGECTIIGEEEAAEGSVWYVCSDTSSVAGADCAVEEFGTGGGLGILPQEGEVLCKAPKVSQSSAAPPAGQAAAQPGATSIPAWRQRWSEAFPARS